MEKEVNYIRPITVTNPREFPYDETLPEGCILLEEMEDEFGYVVYYSEEVYARRRNGNQMTTLHLHIYEPQLPEFETTNEERDNIKWPVIVFVQGSAFHKQKMFGHANMHMKMAARGYLIGVVEYRPSDIAPFPAQMQDCKTAIRYMKKHADRLHADSSRIALWGDSSGAHTALMAGFTGDDAPDSDVYKEYSATVNCIIDWFGPTDFSKMNMVPSAQDHIYPDSPEGFEIGRLNVLEHPDITEKTIPMKYLTRTKAIPPLLIMHGGRDMLVPFQQSCLLYNRMTELGKKVIFYKIKDANHGIYGFSNEKILDLIEEFIKKYM
ncbi:MAG: alpha/beta hydrolase fold domain-containing protein [Lachnospiraceae bacterium]